MSLPDTYKQVEYIQGTGSQYIVTSIIPSNTKGIYAKLSTQNYSNDVVFVGSRQSTETRFWIGNAYDGNNSRGYFYLGWNSNDSFYPIATDTIYEFYLNYLNDRIKKVGSSTLATNLGTLSSSSNKPIYIFAGNNNGSIIGPSQIKLYSLKISDGSNIAYDFVPVIRKSDNKPGLYDLVNNLFYTNAGTGEFTYKEYAESGKITHIYLGTNLIRPSAHSTFEYSYDFRNKSWSTVQSDGWTLAQGTSWTTINSNGINCPTRGQGDSNKFWINRSIDNIGSAKKVTVTMQVYVYASSWGNLAYYKLAAANTPISIAPSMQIAYSGTTASGYQGHTGQLGLPNNETITSPTTIYTGTFLCEGEVDLVNKTSKLTVNGTVVKTGTVSDSTVSAIKDGAYIHVFGGHDTGTIYIQTVSIKIEY